MPDDGITSEPECDYFIVQIPVEFFNTENTEIDLTERIIGLCAGWTGSSQVTNWFYGFYSGTLKVSLNEEDHILTLEMDAVTFYGEEIKVSYSGTYADVVADSPYGTMWELFD